MIARVQGDPPVPRRRMAPQQRREQLVAAAVTLMGRRPVDQVSVDDITTEAGVSRALFYRYFSGPAELFLEAMRVAVDRIVATLTTAGLTAQGAPPDPRVQLREALVAFGDFAVDNAPSFVALLRNGSILATSSTDAMVDEVRRAAVGSLIAVADLGPPTRLSLLTLQCWVAVVEGTTLTWLQEAGLDRRVLEDWLIAQLLGMIRATATVDPWAQRLIERFS